MTRCLVRDMTRCLVRAGLAVAAAVLQHTATHFTTVQLRTCNTLQHTVLCSCHTLQHAAPRCLEGAAIDTHTHTHTHTHMQHCRLCLYALSLSLSLSHTHTHGALFAQNLPLELRSLQLLEELRLSGNNFSYLPKCLFPETDGTLIAEAGVCRVSESLMGWIRVGDSTLQIVGLFCRI